jgi:hypothetical protein
VVGDVEERECVARVVAGWLPTVRLESPFFTEEGGLKDFTPTDLEHFMRQNLGNTSSNPGIPWNFYHQTVSQVLDDDLLDLHAAVRARLKARLNMTGLETALELFKQFARGLVALFLKNEPTKVSKICTGRIRIISNPDFADRVADQIVWTPVLDTVMRYWATCPLKPGMGLDDANLDVLRAGAPVPSLEEELISDDASMWDWSAKLWLALGALQVVYLITGQVLSWTINGTRNDWSRLAWASIYCGFNHIFVEGSGVLYFLPPGAVMESGWLLTAFLNSLMRTFLYVMVYMRVHHRPPDPPIAMGDDCVSKCDIGRWPEMQAEYRKLGFTINRPDLKSGVLFEFCSTDFYADRAIPQHGAKMLFALLSKEPELLLRFALTHELRADPNLAYYLNVAEQVGWTCS